MLDKVTFAPRPAHPRDRAHDLNARGDGRKLCCLISNQILAEDMLRLQEALSTSAEFRTKKLRSPNSAGREVGLCWPLPPHYRSASCCVPEEALGGPWERNPKRVMTLQGTRAGLHVDINVDKLDFPVSKILFFSNVLLILLAIRNIF